MSKKKRRNHSAAFKARIAKEALKGVKTINEIAAENQLHPVQVSTWKKELEDNMESLFERKNAADAEKEQMKTQIARMERILGQHVVEKEWLIKKCEQLGIDP